MRDGAASRRPRFSMRTLFLAPGVHAAVVRRDLVLLDTRADAYLCLADAAATRLDDWRLACDDPVAEALRSAGLVGDGVAAAPYRFRPLPPPPVRGVGSAGSGSMKASAASAQLLATWLGRIGRRPTIAALARRVGRRPTAAADDARLAEAVEAFRSTAPLFPAVGACLFQAWWLLGFLQARGLDATWVFGVRTWPFAAHCWLQAGDLCLTEPPEILAIYRPILAI